MKLEHVVQNVVVQTQNVLNLVLGDAIFERAHVDDRAAEQHFAVFLLQKLEQILNAIVNVQAFEELRARLVGRAPLGHDIEDERYVKRKEKSPLEHVLDLVPLLLVE
jgi:hypothetical protein